MSIYIEKLSCEDHVNMAIDEYIDKYETFPSLESTDEGKCSYCELKAIYKISGNSSEQWYGVGLYFLKGYISFS